MSKFAKNECVRMEVLIKICLSLDVVLGDIMEIVK
nr:helix-turn-helix domain-containing protein [Lachnospira eligens]